MEYSESLLAYLAGEGCIEIKKWEPSNNRSVMYCLQVSATQINPAPIEILAQFGGQVTIGKEHANQRPVHKWRIKSQQAAHFLKLVLPFLTVKKP